MGTSYADIIYEALPSGLRFRKSWERRAGPILYYDDKCDQRGQ